MSGKIQLLAAALILGLGISISSVCGVRIAIEEQYSGANYPQYLDELHPQYDAHYETQPHYAEVAPKKARKPKGQDFSKIPGSPGIDYPILHEVPHTNFHCGAVPATPGMYANVETGCQAYHVCHDGREGDQGAKFLCTNGTIFNQKEFTCDWWYNVNCEEAQNYYHLNADPEHNPYYPKKKVEELQHDKKFLINL